MRNYLKKLLLKINYNRTQNIAEIVLPFINTGDKVLDLGAGPGKIAKYLFEKKEIKINLLDIVDNCNQTNLPLKVYDGTKIPYKDNYFECTLVIFVLHHSQDPDLTLSEATRVVKNRIIIFEDVCNNKLEFFLTFAWDVLVNSVIGGEEISLKFKSDQEWKKRFSELDLTVLYEKKVRLPFYRPTNQKVYVLSKNQIPLCPICQSPKREFFLKSPNRILYQCCRCNLIYVWPKPKKEFVKNLYQKEYYQLASGKKILGYRDYEKQEIVLETYFKKKLEQINKLVGGRRGKLLDIGCALGYFLELANKDGWDVSGLDISDYVVGQVRKKELRVVKGELIQQKFKPNSFDVMTIFQTVEHDLEPSRLLSEIRRVLKPGGVLILTTPGQKGILLTLLGKKWHGWQVEGHVVWFDKRSLKLALKKAGFRKIKVKNDLLVWSSLIDTFEAIKERYPNIVSKTLSGIINLLPRQVRQAVIIPQLDLQRLSAIAIK